MVSKVLKEVLERLESWPEERQDDAARVLIEMEQQNGHSSRLSDEQVEEIERRLANKDRQFVSFATVREDFRRRRA